MQSFDVHTFPAARARFPVVDFVEVGCLENASYDNFNDFAVQDDSGQDPFGFEFDRLHPPPCWKTDILCTPLPPISGWDTIEGAAVTSLNDDGTLTLNEGWGELEFADDQLEVVAIPPWGGLDNFDGFSTGSWTGAGEENGSAGGDPATSNTPGAPNEFTSGIYATAT